MNNVELLTATLAEDPTNDIVAWMLRDELTDVRDMLPTEAERYVTTMRSALIHQRDLDRVARWFAKGNVFSEGLKDEMVRLAKVILQAGAQVVLCAGSAAPKAHHPNPLVSDSYWRDVTVTVGASWVLDHYKELAVKFDRANPPRVSKRKK